MLTSHDTVQGKQHKYAINRLHNSCFLSTDQEKQLHTVRNFPQSSHLASVSAPVDDPRVPQLPPDGRGDPALHRDRIHTLKCPKFFSNSKVTRFHTLLNLLILCHLEIQKK